MNTPDTVSAVTIPGLPVGAFVRVAASHNDQTRAGKDGQVMSTCVEGVVNLIFGFDRFNRDQRVQSVGPEAWLLEELDLATVEV